jgi:starch phosphorylase
MTTAWNLTKPLRDRAGTLGYTNHTLLPEALERWSTWAMGSVLPRHMQIIEDIDAWHAKPYPATARKHCNCARTNEVHMGDLAFIMSHKVNGVSALHTELVKRSCSPSFTRLHPDRIINQTNGVTPRRWMKLANPTLSALVTRCYRRRVGNRPGQV